MRVLHVNKRYPPHIGGIERHVQELARAEAERPGVDVEVVVVAEGAVGEEWDEGVRVHRVPGRGTVASNPLSPALHRFLAESARSGAHDVWHFHYPFPSGELSLVASSVCSDRRPPTVCSYHSDMVATSTVKRALSTTLCSAHSSLSPERRRGSRRLAPAGCQFSVPRCFAEEGAGSAVRDRSGSIRAHF